MNLIESGCIDDPSACKSSKFTIDSNTTVYKIEYEGSNIKNGAIIECHGGGYCSFPAPIHFAFAELLSKLTGCVIFLLDYKLCPEYKLPYSVDQLISLYSHLLIDFQIPANKIAMTGDSAGGGMILLALQKMKKYSNLNLTQPCCVWLNSPWTNLACNSASYIMNHDIESMMGMPLLSNMSDWCVGNKDADLNVIGSNNKMDAKYSPLFGDFEGLCPMYLTVSVQEMLFDDAIHTAMKAYEQGVDVICDVHPVMFHVWPTFVKEFPEAIVACSKAAYWILRNFKQQERNDKHVKFSKL